MGNFMYCNSDNPELDKRNLQEFELGGDPDKYFKRAYKESKAIILSQLESAEKEIDSMESKIDSLSEGMDEMNHWVRELLGTYKNLEPTNKHKGNNIELLKEWTKTKE